MSMQNKQNAYVLPFEELRVGDVESVGGKNSSLGEMISQLASAGVRVPTGFATTSVAFRDFLKHNQLDQKISERLAKLNVDDVRALAEAGAEIRSWIEGAAFQPQLEADIRAAFQKLDTSSKGSFAVRSSATAEDLPDASFAGQQETFLNVSGIDEVLKKIREVFASLYNDRAISYRVHKGFAHADVALSAGVQRMVRSDLGAAGVMFTLDTESGFSGVVFITSSYGLGETVVQGAVNPDEFYVFKETLAKGKKAIIRKSLGSKLIQMQFAPQGSAERVQTVEVNPEERNRFSISDDDVTELAKYAVIIEKHYGRPMDIEWGKDGEDGKIYILQARPETVKSQAADQVELRYRLKGNSKVITTGRAIGQKIGGGPVRVIRDASEMDRIQPGDVLVGLARLEFIINNYIGVHPRAVLEYPNIDADLKRAVESVARGYPSPRAFYEDKLVEGVATIAAAFYPKPVIVRLSDFKSNEYKKLIGGSRYEPDEENPMLGFRGASRYVSEDFGEAFALECAAMKRVREEMGLDNVE
ncbi:MAG: hypothetical protein EBW18_05400, partial [Burkholderiaceae bacterium]|nr:hypothetical protein [Burkholderiaceae bacterium]